MRQTFNVIIEQGEDGYLISDVVELSGCHSQAKTYDELLIRTKEAIELYLMVKKPKTLSKFLGLQQLEVENDKQITINESKGIY
jgi:predicted RNase H-like HicB family nuclease